MGLFRLRGLDLQEALASGALTIRYQPQIESHSRRVVGIEAFVRWPHPIYGLLGPSAIVPLVDEAELHLEFDTWVLTSICTQAMVWRDLGLRVPLIAANIWSYTLRRIDALHVLDPLSASRIDPRLIELECPRGSTADTALTKTLVRMRRLGLRLASEEYVTGARPSGDLRFDTLKIPFPISRDFRANEYVIRAVVADAARMGARVVADSVETLEQREALREMGVTVTQGYLYGPEMTAGELRSFMAVPAQH